eukprot:scaffold994_cov226-Prasinococcus_capsulatus_cf.AAC.3
MPRPHQREERNRVLSQIRACLCATHAVSGRQVLRRPAAEMRYSLPRSQPRYTGHQLASQAPGLPYTMTCPPANPREPTEDVVARNKVPQKLGRVRKGKPLGSLPRQPTEQALKTVSYVEPRPRSRCLLSL